MKNPEFNLAELYRLLLNLIRTGVVIEVDAENWQCRVQTGELQTTWLNWLTMRAGRSRTWWRPSVGEQVVLLSIGGDLTTAFVLPAIYSNDNPPPSVSEDAQVTTFPDGGWIEYEPESGRYLLKAGAKIVLEAPESIQAKTGEFVIEADRTRINSAVVINGDVTQSGGAMSSNSVVVHSHQHTGVQSGGSLTGGPA
ncbi:phage baseplate assembly protein V [Escherichia sp. ESNIH1]|uniref:phage baseplate assembly protein V n=1 Tax=Escherichia sp. ESNIH1 TaxID=1985876 RepID=UPI000CDD797B|nr:phage baseplate assembly protein V [Escherichia sp. ESNIH1]POT97247.1 phage baseplate assembly protein V [Escherichia sp. ESNIH1]HEM8018348.1 phage baseplate assembly protein V [Enterobacter chengduensis]